MNDRTPPRDRTERARPTLSSLGASLDDQLRRTALQERRVVTLSELGRELTRPMDEDALVSVGLTTLMGFAGTPHAALWTADEREPGVFRLSTAHGVSTSELGAACGGLARLAGMVVAGTTPAVATTDELEGPLDDLTLAHLRRCGLDLVGTLMSAEEVLGFIGLGQPLARRDDDPFDRLVFDAACGMLGVGLANARLIARLHGRSQELANANHELAQLDAMKSEFLQTVNHELRTPLAVIIGASSCLRDGAVDAEGHARFVEMIHTQAAQLNQMIQTMLDFSAATSLQIETNQEPVHLGHLLDVYQRSRAPRVERGGRHIAHVASPEPVVALADPRRIAEVLERLVDNATRFTPVGSRVVLGESLEVHEGGRWAVVEVTDDGPGIPAERLERIFRPFEQVDGSSTRTIGGLGLGLAAARSLTEAMGGTLEARSEPGQGSRFRMMLPAA